MQHTNEDMPMKKYSTSKKKKNINKHLKDPISLTKLGSIKKLELFYVNRFFPVKLVDT